MTTKQLPLQARGLVKWYRQGSTVVDALRGVDLAISAGEFVAIMGPAGSGKSTLLLALAGLISLDGGTVLIGGQDLSQLFEDPLTRFRRANVGVVFQAFNLIPALSAEEYVRLPAMESQELPAKGDGLLERLEVATVFVATVRRLPPGRGRLRPTTLADLKPSIR
ncbi:MAG: ATP-binding cassette domain-containing protein [Planctomycetaceae bacterium]